MSLHSQGTRKGPLLSRCDGGGYTKEEGVLRALGIGPGQTCLVSFVEGTRLCRSHTDISLLSVVKNGLPLVGGRVKACL